jgi:dephospho-CoA kinase
MAVKPRPLCIGLTGGIGSGKTTVTNFFKKFGASIIDSDTIAREVTHPGTSGFAAIVAHFGENILTREGGLDRKKLRGIIFKDSSAKQWLENALHPLILLAIREQISTITTLYCIIVIPLLAEINLAVDFLDRVCVVDAPESLRKQWAMERDQASPSEIEAIMEAQTTRENRLALANDVIINNHNLDALEAQVKKLHLQYLQMASS